MFFKHIAVSVFEYDLADKAFNYVRQRLSEKPYGFGYCRALDAVAFGKLVDTLLKECRDGELLVAELNEFARQLNITHETNISNEKRRWEELYKSIGEHKCVK